jgi:TRAP-type uncharacterized transport system substrate-binding protein
MEHIKELFLAFVRKPNLTIRTLIWLFSVTFAVFVYTYIVDAYDPDSNIIASVTTSKKNIFFSGDPGGFYISIGNEIGNELRKKSHSVDFNNIQTAGANENAINVYVTPNSFGLIQEETIKNSDFIKKGLNYITPLYVERMHVLYRIDKIKERLSENPLFNKITNYNALNIRISSQLNEETIDFFTHGKVSTGPVGSNSRIVANYILNYINNQLINKSQTLDNNTIEANTESYSITEGLAKLQDKDGEIDAVFLIAGSPIKSVRNALKNEHIYLMSIESSVVANLNKDYGLNFRISDFKRKYTDISGEKNKNISTLGSYAFLIASKDVSDTNIMELISALHDIKGNIKNEISFPENGKEQFQLDEFNFYESFELKNTNAFFITLKNILLFIVTFITTMAMVLASLVWIISEFKQTAYFKKIYQLVDDYMPKSQKIDDHNSYFPLPRIKSNLIEEIANLIRGLNGLMGISIDLHNDYQEGGITDKHYIFLTDNLKVAKEKLQSNLYRRLKIFLQRGNFITKNELKNYFISEFINNEQYDFLIKILKKNDQRN